MSKALLMYSIHIWSGITYKRNEYIIANDNPFIGYLFRKSFSFSSQSSIFYILLWKCGVIYGRRTTTTQTGKHNNISMIWGKGGVDIILRTT